MNPASVILMMVLLVCSAADASNIYYVDPLTGNDGNSGLTLDLPKATINGAIIAASDGDTIKLVAGDYVTGGVDVDINEPNKGKSLTIESYSTKVSIGAGDNYGCVVFSTNDGTGKTLTFNNVDFSLSGKDADKRFFYWGGIVMGKSFATVAHLHTEIISKDWRKVRQAQRS